jgi:hypothetical protein
VLPPTRERPQKALGRLGTCEPPPPEESAKVSLVAFVAWTRTKTPPAPEGR